MPFSSSYSSSNSCGTGYGTGSSSRHRRSSPDDYDYNPSYGSSSKYDGSDYEPPIHTYKSKYGASSKDHDSILDADYISSKSKYGISPTRDYDSFLEPEYNTSRRSGYSTYSNASTATTRGISPPRCDAERPRQQRSYSDHRSISPLGSSRFEKSVSYSSRPSGEVREPTSYGDHGHYGESDTTSSFRGAGVSRSSAIRGRAPSDTNRRGFGSSTGLLGGSSGGRYGTRRLSYGSSWEQY